METFNPNTDVTPLTPMSAPQEKKGVFSKVGGALGSAGKAVGNVAVGFGKGALDTVASVPRNIKKVGDAVYDVTVEDDFTAIKQSINDQNDKLIKVYKSLPPNDPRKQKYIELLKQNMKQIEAVDLDSKLTKSEFDANTSKITALDKYATPTNGAQRVGFAGEKIAEFFVPASHIAKADKAISGFNLLNNTSKTAKVINSATRVLGKAGTEAMGAGGVSLAQSGYQGRFDTGEGAKSALKDARNIAATAGAIKGVFSGLGEILTANKTVPKKLYNQVYKDTPKDAEEWFRNAGNANKSGTTSEWAYEKGIRGNLKQQAAQVGKILKQSEDDVVNAAERSGHRVEVPTNLKKLAVSLKSEYATHGRGEIANQVDDFVKASNKGDVSVKEALKFRRFLDSLRAKTSFRNPKIGDDIAYWADDLRGQVNAVNDIGKINKDYAFAIKAKEALMKAATSTGNQKLIGQVEAGFEGLAVLEGKTLEGLGVIALKRALQMPRVQAGLAQGMKNLGENTGTKVLPFVPKIPGKFSPGIRAGVGKFINDQTKEDFTRRR